MPRLPKERWAQAQEKWEKEGWSQKRIAEWLGVALTTVENHKKKEEWTRGDPTDAEKIKDSFAEEQQISVEEAGVADRTDADSRLAELEARLAEVEAEKADLAEKAQGTKSLEVWSSADEVIDHFGADHLREVAETRINAQRKAQGFLAIDFGSGEHEDRITAEVRKVAQEIFERKEKVRNARHQKNVKLWFNGNIIPYPVEPHVNNESKQPGNGLNRMRAKGARLITPYLCQYGDCYAVAAVDEATGQFTHEGYCGEAHQATDPYSSARRKQGVTTSMQAGALVR